MLWPVTPAATREGKQIHAGWKFRLLLSLLNNSHLASLIIYGNARAGKQHAVQCLWMTNYIYTHTADAWIPALPSIHVQDDMNPNRTYSVNNTLCEIEFRLRLFVLNTFNFDFRSDKLVDVGNQCRLLNIEKNKRWNYITVTQK